MATKHKRLSTNQLTGSLVTQYTVPASTNTTRICFLIHNTDSAQHTVTIHHVPSGGSALATNIFWEDVVLPNSTNQWVDLGSLSAGDFISAKADTGALVNLQISGDEVV
mgnify:CR=1 FL=1